MAVCQYVCVCMSACLVVCLHVCLSVCFSVHMHVCMYVCMYVCVCLSVFLSVWCSVCMSVCLSVCTAVCMSVCMSVCLSVCMPVCMYVCLYVCLPACLPALYVYLSVSWWCVEEGGGQTERQMGRGISRLLMTLWHPGQSPALLLHCTSPRLSHPSGCCWPALVLTFGPTTPSISPEPLRHPTSAVVSPGGACPRRHAPLLTFPPERCPRGRRTDSFVSCGAGCTRVPMVPERQRVCSACPCVGAAAVGRGPGMQTYRQTHRHTDTQTQRQTDTHTDRQTDRQTSWSRTPCGTAAPKLPLMSDLGCEPTTPVWVCGAPVSRRRLSSVQPPSILGPGL